MMRLLILALVLLPAMAVAQAPTDGDLQTFVAVYTGMEDVRTVLAQELDAAATPEQAESIRASATGRMEAVIVEQGWTLDRYNEVAAAINADDALRARVLDLLQERP
jgi:hypothetical protein